MRLDHGVIRYGIAAVVTGLMVGLTECLQTGLSQQVLFMPAMLAVMIAGLLGGLGPAVLSMVVGVVAIDLRFMAPVGSIWTMAPADRGYLTAFLLLSGVAAAIAAMARRARADAVAASARLEALMASMPVGVTFVDNDGRYLSINQYMAEINGAPPAAHLGRRLTDILPEAVAANIVAIQDQIRRTGEALLNLTFHGPIAGREQEGERHLRGSFFPVRMDGTIVGMGAAVFDITAEHRADELLRQQGVEFRLLAETLTVMVWRLTVGGKATYLNAAAMAYFGVEAMHHLADDWSMAVHPDDAQTVSAAWLQGMASGKPYVVEGRLQRAGDGMFRWHLIHGSPLFDEKGAISEWLGTSTDIHDQRQIRAEQEDLIGQLRLAEAEQWRRAEDFRLLADMVPHIIWTKVRADGTDFLNQRGMDFFGLDSGERSSQDWHQNVHPDDVPKLQLWSSSQAAGRSSVEIRLRRHDGVYRWHAVRRVPVYDADGRVSRWIGSSTDIEEHKQAILLRETFLSVASHELKTPITALLLQLHVLQRRLGEAEPALRQRIDVACRHGERLTKLVNNLLDVSRIISGRFDDPQAVCLRDVVDEVVDRFVLELEEVGFEVLETAPQPLVGHWDRLQVDQILTNLLTNALKYGQGSRITIRLGLDGTEARLDVGDAGPGIAMEDFGRVFQQYHRLSSADGPPGHGLGLWIVQHMAERMGGRVSVQSQPGDGATFTVRLPLHPA